MSGVLRTVVKVAAVVAAVALAIPSGGTSLLAVALGVSGTAAAAIGIGLSIGSSLLASKPKAPTVPPTATDRLTTSINPRAFRKIWLGTTCGGNDTMDQEFTDDQEYLHRFIVVASHKVEEITNIYFDDDQVWSAGSTLGTWVDYLEITPILEGSAANAINLGARMGSSRRYTGCAYIHIKYKLTGKDKKTSSPFASSIPTRITIQGKGAPVYDPRMDSTNGGSGSQRPDDQSTWVYGSGGYDPANNPALQLLWYLIGWQINGKLAVGKGIPVDRIDLASFITAANLCDEGVSLAVGGTEMRYQSAGVFSEGDSPTTVIDNLKAAMNAILDDVDGKIRLTVLHNDLASPIASFTDDDVLGAFDWKQTQPLNDSFNVIRGSYPSPPTLYQMSEYPEVRLASIDGIDRIESIDFAIVQSPSQVQRLAKQRLQRAQYGGMFSAEFQCTAWRVQKGDVVKLTFSPLGWTDKLFRVVETSVRVDGIVPMVLREENAEIYLWDHEESPAVTPADNTTYDPLPPPPVPDAGAWTLTAGTTVDGFPCLIVDGIAEAPNLDAVLIEFRKTADTDWKSDAQHNASEPVHSVITPVDGATEYEAHIAYRSGPRVSADWLLLPPVTTPDITVTINASLQPTYIQLPVNERGEIASWAAAISQFVATTPNGTDISANFTLSTEDNPETLDVTYTDQTISIAGGLEEDDPGTSLLVKATGDGDYEGKVLYLLLGVSKQSNFDYARGANDRNVLVPDAPTLVGSPFHTGTDELGDTSESIVLNYAYDVDSTHKNSIDYIERLVWWADTNASHTLGTDELEERQEFTPLPFEGGDLTDNFWRMRRGDKYLTVGYRTGRVVQPGLGFGGGDRIYSSIVQTGPYQPYSTLDMGGVNIDLLAAQYEDYSDNNDLNGTTPTSATSVTLSGVNFNDGGGETLVSWSYTTSTTSTAANNIDGFRVGLMRRASSAGYTYSSADDNDIWWEVVAPNVRKVAIPAAVDQYCTGIVIPFRNVLPSVAASTIKNGTPAQSSSSTPFRQASSPNFTGSLAGIITTADVADASGRALIAITSGGNVATAKVLSGSILTDAINAQDWVADTSGIVVFASEDHHESMITMTVRNKRAVVQLLMDCEIRVTDPDQGSFYSFGVYIEADPVGAGSTVYSDLVTVSDQWHPPDDTGLKSFSRSTLPIQATFEGLPAGAYNFGWRAVMASTNETYFRATRYMRVEDMGAAE